MKTQTQRTDIPEMTQEERNLLDLITNSVLPSYMEEAGYTAKATKYETFADTPTGQQIQKNLNAWKPERDRLANDLARNWWSPKGRVLMDQVKELDKKIQSAQEEWDKGVTTYVPGTTEYTYEKALPAQLQLVADQYGKDSEQFKKAEGEYKKAKAQTEVQQDEIQKLYLDKVEKYLSGDLTITDEQKQFVTEQMAPIKAAVDSMYSESMAEVRDRYAKFSSEVDKSQLSIEQALDAVGTQVKATGADMEKALSSTIAANRELMKMGIEDATGEITKKISMQAIATGRDPSDPEYTNEIQTNIARQIKSGELQMTAMEAQSKMGIAERTGSGLESIAQAKARLEEATGGKREQAIMSQGLENQGLIQGRGQAGVRLAEAGSNLSQNLALGLPPSQIGIGTGFEQLQQALAAQRLANASAPMQAIGYPYSLLSQERFSQPTTSVSRPTTFGDVMGGILGLGSMGAGIYSGIVGANALRGIAGGMAAPAAATSSVVPRGMWT